MKKRQGTVNVRIRREVTENALCSSRCAEEYVSLCVSLFDSNCLRCNFNQWSVPYSILFRGQLCLNGRTNVPSGDEKLGKQRRQSLPIVIK